MKEKEFKVTHKNKKIDNDKFIYNDIYPDPSLLTKLSKKNDLFFFHRKFSLPSIFENENLKFIQLDPFNDYNKNEAKPNNIIFSGKFFFLLYLI